MRLILALILIVSTAFANPKPEIITQEDVALEVFSLEYDGHNYLLFFSHIAPEVSSWVHDVDCKKCKYLNLEPHMSEENFLQKIYFVMTIDDEEIRVHRPVFGTEAEAIHFGKLLSTPFYVQEFVESHTTEYQP
jgi:hypothetical protein